MLKEDERSKIQISPPLARGSAPEIFSVCMREPVKKFKKLSTAQTVHWKNLSKESKVILKKAQVEYHKVLKDQLVLYLRWRNSSAENNTLKRLTDEEIAEARRKFKTRTDNEVVLANFAAYLGVLPTLAEDSPVVVQVEDIQLNSNQLEKADGNGNKKMACDYCGNILASKGALNKHLYRRFLQIFYQQKNWPETRTIQ